jgi:hypothetical protein
VAFAPLPRQQPTLPDPVLNVEQYFSPCDVVIL